MSQYLEVGIGKDAEVSQKLKFYPQLVMVGKSGYIQFLIGTTQSLK